MRIAQIKSNVSLMLKLFLFFDYSIRNYWIIIIGNDDLH